MTMPERIQSIISKELEASRLHGESIKLRNEAEAERQKMASDLKGEGVHIVGDNVVRIKAQQGGYAVEIVTAKVWQEPVKKERL